MRNLLKMFTILAMCTTMSCGESDDNNLKKQKSLIGSKYYLLQDGYECTNGLITPKTRIVSAYVAEIRFSETHMVYQRQCGDYLLPIEYGSKEIVISKNNETLTYQGETYVRRDTPPSFK